MHSGRVIKAGVWKQMELLLICALMQNKEADPSGNSNLGLVRKGTPAFTESSED